MKLQFVITGKNKMPKKVKVVYDIILDMAIIF